MSSIFSYGNPEIVAAHRTGGVVGFRKSDNIPACRGSRSVIQQVRDDDIGPLNLATLVARANSVASKSSKRK